MEKSIKPLLAAAMLLSLIACGGGGGGNETNNTDTTKDSDNDGLINSQDTSPNDPSNGVMWGSMTWDNGQWD